MTNASESVPPVEPTHVIVERRFKELFDAWQRASASNGELLAGNDLEFQLAADSEQRLKSRLGFVQRELSSREAAVAGPVQRVPVWIAECLQPRTTLGETSKKVKMALAANVRWVWILNPWSRTVDEYRPDQSPSLVRQSESLSGGEELPGLSIPVNELFARIPPEDPSAKVWVDRLREKHECYSTYVEVRECTVGDERVRYRVGDSFPVFQQVVGAFRGPLLFLCGTTDEDFDDRPCGAFLIGRQADDGIYDVHVWHELYPGACEHLGIAR